MRSAALLLGCWTILSLASAAEPTIVAERTEKGVAIKIDGELFTEYLVRSGNKPVLWPIIGPTGKPMTRAYPFKDDAEGEAKDHIHQRSLWFTHGDVNGVSFWDEGAKSGSIVHREFNAIESEPQAKIVTTNDWVAKDGTKICEDERTLVFGADGTTRTIDFRVTVKASDSPVTFGMTKEGSFGIRVAESMKVDANKGGTIVNSEGQRNGAAWGQPAPWVDYYGSLEGETVGIAILNHPSSFRYPTHWHVRTYGLFAANPFGLKDFGQPGEGAHTIPPGESMTLRYRVLLHHGNEKQADIAGAFERYAKASENRSE
jgi:hypothetical protein